MTNELASYVDLVTGAVKEIESLPISVVLVGVLILLGGCLKTIAAFPNKFIPWVIMFGFGPVLNLLFGSAGSVNSEFSADPWKGLLIQGVPLGLLAWMIHRWLLKRFEKHIPFLAGKTGDTAPPFKPE